MPQEKHLQRAEVARRGRGMGVVFLEEGAFEGAVKDDRCLPGRQGRRSRGKAFQSEETA